MSLVTRTPLALGIGHRDLPNRVNRDAVWFELANNRPRMAVAQDNDPAHDRPV
jgi:hypothetical protein